LERSNERSLYKKNKAAALQSDIWYFTDNSTEADLVIYVTENKTEAKEIIYLNRW
jgi:hypothetical protein